jgi:hypothetical protein
MKPAMIRETQRRAAQSVSPNIADDISALQQFSSGVRHALSDSQIRLLAARLGVRKDFGHG